MRLRITIAVVLIVSTATSAAASSFVELQNSPVVSADERKLTPEEAEEARALVMRFSERLKATNDFAPLVDEMFVSDYSQRLPLAPSGSIPFYFLDKGLVSSAPHNELTRHYIAWMNFYCLAFRLYRAVKDAAEQSGGSNESPEPRNVMPPEVIEVMLRNPMLSPLALELREEADESAKETEANKPETDGNSAQAESTQTEGAASEPQKDVEAELIKTADEMNSVSATLETAVELMRKRLANLPKIPTVSDTAGDQEDSLSFDISTLEEGNYGYPEGTETIHADVEGFCLKLIRMNGELKILAVVVYVD